MTANVSSPDRGVGKIARAEDRGDSMIPCITLDDFAAASGFPDMVKIDVEGGELEVLKGAETFLREIKPAIICALHSEENRRDVGAMLKQYGYSTHTLDDSHIAALP